MDIFYLHLSLLYCLVCVLQPYGREEGAGVWTRPEKSHIWFLSNTGPEPLKNLASIQCCAIIGCVCVCACACVCVCRLIQYLSEPSVFQSSSTNTTHSISKISVLHWCIFRVMKSLTVSSFRKRT